MRSETFTLTRGAVYGMLTTLLWISLPAGIFLAVNESALWGALLLVAGLVLIVLAVSGALTSAMQARQIPRSRGGFMLFVFSFAALMTALYSVSLFELVGPSLMLGVVHAAGILGLGAWAALELHRSINAEST